MFEASQSLEVAIAGLAAERTNGNQMAAMAEEIEMYASLDFGAFTTQIFCVV